MFEYYKYKLNLDSDSDNLIFADIPFTFMAGLYLNKNYN